MTVMEEYSAEIMKIILPMTFTGSIITFFLFLLKPVIKDTLPKSFQYYMWLSAVIALVLPVSKIIVIPVSDHSVMSVKPMYDIARWISNESGQNVRQVTYFPGAAVILSVCWQLGMILVLGFHIICYASYVRRLGRHNNGEIKNAYITIICQGKNPDSGMQNGIKSLASEELELDTQNIYIDYIDLEP